MVLILVLKVESDPFWNLFILLLPAFSLWCTFRFSSLYCLSSLISYFFLLFLCCYLSLSLPFWEQSFLLSWGFDLNLCCRLQIWEQIFNFIYALLINLQKNLFLSFSSFLAICCSRHSIQCFHGLSLSRNGLRVYFWSFCFSLFETLFVHQIRVIRE